MLKLENVETYYGNIRALHGVSLEVRAGEIITLIGGNGAGKSTTLMSISGLTPPRSGEIFFEGRPIGRMNPEEIVALGISQVPEGRRIFPRLSVLENLEMGAYLRRDRVEIQKDLKTAYALFPVLYDRRSQPGGNLSGGEQQMLAISRALMARPRLMLLDEPSLGLAPKIIKQIFSIIKEINQNRNTTIFLVEQNANLALRLAHRGYVLENGRVVNGDSAAALLGDEGVRKAYLGLS